MLYYSFNPHTIIVFEDITKLGYGMFSDRFVNFEEMQIILDKICRWHAVSFKLISEGDDCLNKCTEGVFNMPQEIIDEFFTGSINLFMKTLSALPDQIYYQKFLKIKDNILKKCAEIYRKDGNFCVLNHGDFHVKNLMPKFNEKGKLQDVMLVDFQFPILATIAIDVLYLLYMIIGPDCRSRRNEVIYTYYAKFTEALKNIGYVGRIPSLFELHMEIMKCRHLELTMIAAFLPFVCGMMSKMEFDPEKVMESQDAREIFYTTPIYTDQLKILLPELLYKGYFEE